MRTDSLFYSTRLRFVAAATLAVLVAGCATGPRATDPVDIAASRSLREARSPHFTAEDRLGHYLDAASLEVPRLGTGTEPSAARYYYNAAVGELTVSLRSADGGRLWNHPLDIPSKTTSTATYHLRLQPAQYDAWSPDY